MITGKKEKMHDVYSSDSWEEVDEYNGEGKKCHPQSYL